MKDNEAEKNENGASTTEARSDHEEGGRQQMTRVKMTIDTLLNEYGTLRVNLKFGQFRPDMCETKRSWQFVRVSYSHDQLIHFHLNFKSIRFTNTVPCTNTFQII